MKDKPEETGVVLHLKIHETKAANDITPETLEELNVITLHIKESAKKNLTELLEAARQHIETYSTQRSPESLFKANIALNHSAKISAEIQFLLRTLRSLNSSTEEEIQESIQNLVAAIDKIIKR